MYPVTLSLMGRPCLVVGGGGVALRKVQGLIAEGAAVTVVAPEIVAALETLAGNGEIALYRRAYHIGEANSYSLVFAATNDFEVNRQVFEDAKAANIWVNVADDPDLCTFHLPARVRRNSLQMAISSEGVAPFATRRFRQLMERRIGEEWGEWIQAASRFRDDVLEMAVSREHRERLFDHFFDRTVEPDGLRARVPTEKELIAWLGKPSTPPASGVPGGSLTETDGDKTGPGLVSLVGAGPGDPGLMTLRGRERLMNADAVVCDRLAIPALPCDLPSDVALHFVGKEAGNHPVPQEEINALLVRLSREGKRVVRLKGGDPYVFGRGGEEATELAHAGVPFEVVPCVTAAVAVPAYAGIPVTYRKEVVRVTMVTAHEAIKSTGPQVRWDLLAMDPHAMILGYMGVTNLPSVLSRLTDAGLDPDTPAALIERGTTPMQRKVVSTVRHLEEDIASAGLGPPALFAIGPTIRHSELLDWFGKRPLLGERLLMFNPDGDTLEAMQLSGAEIVGLTQPITPSARMVMDAMPITGCIFKHPDDVDSMEEERDRKSWIKNPRVWCFDDASAARARAMSWPNIRVVDDTEGLIDSMIANRDAGK
jgi:uroporphyrin-III C-methyltransferase/precorrin-2 dehydrogenase/sirohydrochlorin ferrochelatase